VPRDDPRNKKVVSQAHENKGKTQIDFSASNVDWTRVWRPQSLARVHSCGHK